MNDPKELSDRELLERVASMDPETKPVAEIAQAALERMNVGQEES
jgi:hypothetical protein